MRNIILLIVSFVMTMSARGAGAPRVVEVPAQELHIGGRPDEPGYSPSELRYRVVLSAYAIGVTEVTNAEFCEFLNEEGNVAQWGIPAVVLDERGIRRTASRFIPALGRERHPVMRVTWHGARAYCAWLSRRTGEHYDLPTAAQWEAAARGGATTIWPWGDGDDPRQHRTRAAAGDGPVAVASYPPNGLGLYDTTGNVWEWVLDCFDPEFHRYAPLRDPVRFDWNCLVPEIRGGSFLDGSDAARPAFRANYWWAPQVTGIGFRIARAPSGGAR